MTGPTHVAFSCLISYSLDFPESAPFLVSVGSLLPDLDHPRSMVGRALPFISTPLSKLVAHRSWTHSLLFWIPLTVLCFYIYDPFGWLCIGAITHFMLDTLNTGGVQLLAPYSEKIFVCFSSRWRFPVSSPTEFVFCGVLAFSAFGAYHLQQAGGLREVVAHALGSYSIAVQHYKAEGSKVCWLDGELRLIDGRIIEDKFLIIGSVGESGIAVFNSSSNEIVHCPTEGEFLFCQLLKTDENWNYLEISSPQKVTSGHAFYSEDGTEWHLAKVGDVCMGYIIHDGNLKIESLLDRVFSNNS